MVALVLASGGGAAHAHERVWKPRRHHRHMGERVLDSWAADQVEVEEQAKDQHRSAKQRVQVQRQQQAEAARVRQVQEDAAMRKRAQQVLTQQAENMRRPILSLKVGSVDVLPYLVWGGLALAVFATYKSRILARLFPGPARAGGKWVYDRSLGGKKVWVKDGAAVPEGFSEADASADVVAPAYGTLADRKFDGLVSLAAAASQAGVPSTTTKSEGAFKVPDWWDAPPVLYASDEQKAAAQEEADRVVRRLERIKNAGQDYPLSKIVLLRNICQEGCVSVETKTKGGRDAMYATAVEGAVLAAMDQDYGRSDTLRGGSPDTLRPCRFVSAVAQDLRMPEERAVLTVRQSVAKALRLRLVDAVTSLRAGDEAAARPALVRLTTLLHHMPVLQQRSLEVALLAGSLQDSSSVEERQRIFLIAGALLPESAAVLAAMLGFEPEMVVPQLQEQLFQARRSGTWGGAGTAGLKV